MYIRCNHCVREQCPSPKLWQVRIDAVSTRRQWRPSLTRLIAFVSTGGLIIRSDALWLKQLRIVRRRLAGGFSIVR